MLSSHRGRARSHLQCRTCCRIAASDHKRHGLHPAVFEHGEPVPHGAVCAEQRGGHARRSAAGTIGRRQATCDRDRAYDGRGACVDQNEQLFIPSCRPTPAQDRRHSARHLSLCQSLRQRQAFAITTFKRSFADPFVDILPFLVQRPRKQIIVCIPQPVAQRCHLLRIPTNPPTVVTTCTLDQRQ